MQQKQFFISIICFLILIGFTPKLSAQHDADTLYNVLVQYSLRDNFRPDSFPQDTGLELFHIFKATEKNSLSVSDLGNIGTANMSNVYFSRIGIEAGDFLPAQAYSLFMLNPQNIKFYNTRRPYTSFFESMSSKVKDEQTLQFTHTQNVSPFFNLGFNYNLISSLGEYPYQQTRMNSAAVHSNYSKGAYLLHAAFTFNNFKVEENGGIIDTGFVDLNALSSFMSDANSRIGQRDFFVSQKYLFGAKKMFQYKDTTVRRVPNPIVSVGHSFDYGLRFRTYQDAQTAEDGIYENFYYMPSATYDSLAYRFIENRVSVNSESGFEKKYKFGFSFAVGNSLKKYFNFKDYIYKNYNTYFADNFVVGTLRKSVGNWQAELAAEKYLTGYEAGSQKLSFDIAKQAADSSLISTHFRIESRKTQVDFFTRELFSNHYIWQNSFRPIQSTRVSLSFGIPKYSLTLDINGEQLQHYIYNDSRSYPAQHDAGITILSASLTKNFHFSRLHIHNSVIWQQSSGPEVLNIPQIVAYHSLYVSLRYQTHLVLNAGYETYFSTEYKAQSYNPAIGQFYFENALTVGNYPIANIFIDAKVKRNFMFFFKIEHVNAGMLQDLYTPTAHYPIKSRTWKLGVNWTFKN